MENQPDKNQKAVEIVAQKISVIPANVLMDHGTVGNLNHWTKRESEADSMARYFVERLYGVKFTGDLYENWTEDQKQANELVKEIAAAAIKITGK